MSVHRSAAGFQFIPGKRSSHSNKSSKKLLLPVSLSYAKLEWHKQSVLLLITDHKE